MQKMIFHLMKSNFFGSSHFLVYFLRSNGSKNDRSQKIYFYEKSVFTCPSTSRRNFWILLMLWLDFHDWFLKLWEVISNWRNIFSKKFLAQIITYGWYFASGYFKKFKMFVLTYIFDRRHYVLLSIALISAAKGGRPSWKIKSRKTFLKFGNTMFVPWLQKYLK